MGGGEAKGLLANKARRQGREKVLIKKLFFVLAALHGTKKLDKTDEVDKSRC